MLTEQLANGYTMIVKKGQESDLTCLSKENSPLTSNVILSSMSSIAEIISTDWHGV